jgi:undecaprenyl-diphosphatase
VDDAAWQVAVNMEHSVLVGLATALDLVGGSMVAAPIMVIVAIYLAWRKRWEGFWFWALAMDASQMLIGPVKILYARPRPPMPLVETTSYSFPSGHAVAGAAIAVALVIVLVPAGPKRRNLEMLAGVFVLFMGRSRVYLCAHRLSDAAAGVAAGEAVSISAAVIIHMIDERRHRAPQEAS